MCMCVGVGHVCPGLFWNVCVVVLGLCDCSSVLDHAILVWLLGGFLIFDTHCYPQVRQSSCPAGASSVSAHLFQRPSIPLLILLFLHPLKSASHRPYTLWPDVHKDSVPDWLPLPREGPLITGFAHCGAGGREPGIWHTYILHPCKHRPHRCQMHTVTYSVTQCNHSSTRDTQTWIHTLSNTQHS
jgi:hypothetical protein